MALPVAAMCWVLRVSIVYLKIKGTPTFKTFAPISKPIAILTLFRISGLSYNINISILLQY